MTILQSELLCVLLTLVIVVECQLHFDAEQGPQELSLHCYVRGIKAFNYTHPAKLVVLNSSESHLQILASVSVHQSQTGPWSNVSNAQITGQISYDPASKRFLKIQWTEPHDGLNGNYTCQAYGINNELLSSEHLSVTLRPTGLHLEATPSVIHIGLSKRLDISCSVPDPARFNVSKVGCFEVYKIQNGYECLFARVWSASGRTFTTGLKELHVSGSIQIDNARGVISWRNPTSEHSGEYICQCFAVGLKGDPVFFSRRINVTWEQPDVQLLLRRVSELSSRHDELVGLEQEENQLLHEAVQTLNVTEKSQCRNPRSCDDVYFTLKPGQHIIRVEPEDGLGPITVLCHVIARREIYTVFQKRFNGKVDFYRNFKEYEDGFGSLDGEFWLGLKNIRRLLVQNGDKNQLRVDMTVMGSGINYTRIYPNFSVGPGDDYRLTVSGLYDRGFGMSSNSWKQFSTYDHGLKNVAHRNSRGAGWWFPEDQGYVNLNGIWGVSGKPYSIFWWELRQDLNVILERTEMKFKRSI